MTQAIATSGNEVLLSPTGISGVSGTIDTGTNGANVLVPFTITDDQLSIFDNAEIHAVVGSGQSNDQLSITSSGDDSTGLFVDMNTGSVTQDDFGIPGTPTDSVAADPTITINYTAAATGSPPLPRATWPEKTWPQATWPPSTGIGTP